MGLIITFLPMKYVLFTISLILGATAVGAGYINDRDEWDELVPQAKSLYAMGLFDAMSLTEMTDDAAILEFKKNVKKCVIEYDLRPENLADIIDDYYQEGLNDTTRPHYVLMYALMRFCKLDL